MASSSFFTPQTARRAANRSTITIIPGVSRYSSQQSTTCKTFSQATTDEAISYQHRSVSSQQRQSDISRKSVETHIGRQESPSVKRRFQETDLIDSLAELQEQIKALRQSNDSLHVKVDEAREQILRLSEHQQKSTKQINQLSHIKNNSFQPFSTPKRFPVIEYNGKNLMTSHPPPNQPTLFMCKLIRDLYSDIEIEAGIADDDRLDAVKCAVEAAYFHTEPDLFELWWNNEGKNSRRGQRRKQRSTNKKKPHIHQELFRDVRLDDNEIDLSKNIADSLSDDFF